MILFLFLFLKKLWFLTQINFHIDLKLVWYIYLSLFYLLLEVWLMTLLTIKLILSYLYGPRCAKGRLGLDWSQRGPIGAFVEKVRAQHQVIQGKYKFED